MLLGTLLKQLQDDRFAADTLFALGDITLSGRAAQAGAPYGENAGEYAASACARFSGGASDEDWLALMTALEKGTDPAATCLRTMVDWSIRTDAAEAEEEAEGEVAKAVQGGCGCGGSGGCGGHGHGPV